MRLCGETVTVCNARLNEASGYDEYFLTVIRGVSCHGEWISTVDASGGLLAANRYVIRVPEDADFSGKTYVTPEAYRASDPEATFTFRAGDIFIRGEVTDTGARPADWQRSGGEIVTILAVTDNRRAPRGKHWKVVGR